MHLVLAAVRDGMLIVAGPSGFPLVEAVATNLWTPGSSGGVAATTPSAAGFPSTAQATFPTGTLPPTRSLARAASVTGWSGTRTSEGSGAAHSSRMSFDSPSSAGPIAVLDRKPPVAKIATRPAGPGRDAGSMSKL